MTRNRTMARDVSIGIVLTVAAVIIGAAIFSIGSEKRLWSRKITYRLSLPNTNGLQVGAPVRLSGVQVGTVTDIVLPSDPSQVDIEVVFTVDGAAAPRIREDSQATLKVLSVLAGDRFVELSTGSPSAPELAPGSFVKTPQEVTLDELQALGATIADDLLGVTGSLKVILAQLQDRSTVLGQALFDPNFGRETLGGLSRSIQGTERILEEIERGRGLAGRLLTDETLAESVLTRLDSSLGRLDEILTVMAGEQGSLMKALAPGGPVDSIVSNLLASSEALLAVTGKLKEGDGVAVRLLSDTEYADALLADLADATRALKEIAEKLNGGEGSAGAFINDPALYEELQDVIRGVRESKTMSWLIRHYQKKGEKARIKEEKDKAPAEAELEGL